MSETGGDSRRQAPNSVQSIEFPKLAQDQDVDKTFCQKPIPVPRPLRNLDIALIRHLAGIRCILSLLASSMDRLLSSTLLELRVHLANGTAMAEVADETVFAAIAFNVELATQLHALHPDGDPDYVV